MTPHELRSWLDDQRLELRHKLRRDFVVAPKLKAAAVCSLIADKGFSSLGQALLLMRWAEDLGRQARIKLVGNLENLPEHDLFQALFQPRSLTRSPFSLGAHNTRATNEGSEELVLHNVAELPDYDKVARPSTFAEAHNLWARYFELKPGIADEVQSRADTHGIDGHTLAAHYGKAEPSLGVSTFSPTTFISRIREYLDQHPECERVFLTSPDRAFAERAEGELDADVKLSEYDGAKPNMREQLIDCLLMARSGALIRTVSPTAVWANIFNPELKAYRVNTPARLNEWDPEALHRQNAPLFS